MLITLFGYLLFSIYDLVFAVLVTDWLHSHAHENLNASSESAFYNQRKTKMSTLTFITESIPQFTVGVFQEFVLEASGGTPPYTFEITQGTLPQGLTFNNGTISGIAETPDTSTVFFKLTDSAGDNLTQTMEVVVVVGETSSASA